MSNSNQLRQFAGYFHQDFGDSPGDSLQDNILGFFISPYYLDGQSFIEQIDKFTKIALSPSGRGSSWRDLGGGRWSRELENPLTWDAIKTLAQEFPDNNCALGQQDEFNKLMNKLLPHQ